MYENTLFTSSEYGYGFQFHGSQWDSDASVKRSGRTSRVLACWHHLDRTFSRSQNCRSFKWSLLLRYLNGSTVHLLSHMTFKQIDIFSQRQTSLPSKCLGMKGGCGLCVSNSWNTSDQTQSTFHPADVANTAAVSFVFFNNKVSKIQCIKWLCWDGEKKMYLWGLK